MIDTIRNKVHAHQSITREEAGWLYGCADDADLRELASFVRARYHKSNTATYLVMAIVNYTNVCIAKCDYCSFYRLPNAKDTYLLSTEQVCQQIDVMQELGGTLVSFNGGFHPKLRITDYAKLFGEIREKYKDEVDFFEFTVAEFMFYCKVSKVSYDEGARILAESGTRWITGGGAEILDDRFRKRHSPLKYKVEDYYTAQKAILDAGMGSTATMVIGFDESLDERLSHLERLRTFQTDTHGSLPSFLCWTYKPYNNELGGSEIDSESYMRWLAVSRIYLDNIPHIRTSVLTKNEDALKGLHYGANDFDLPTEDEVTTKAGARISHEFETILASCKAQGFEPQHRAPFGLRGEVALVEPKAA